MTVPTAAFGRVPASKSTAPVLATFTLTVSCTRTPPLGPLVLVELELTAVPAKQQRLAYGDAGTATYGLFLDPAQTLAWGDGSANTHSITDAFVIVGNTRTVTHSYTLYGRVDGGQTLGVGNYLGALATTLEYRATCGVERRLPTS